MNKLGWSEKGKLYTALKEEEKIDSYFEKDSEWKSPPSMS